MTAQNATSPPVAQREPSAVVRFFGNPVVGMVGTLASILGVLLAIYFYMQSTKFHELVYYVNPAQAIVVKAGEVSRLRVSIGDRELKSDVTTAQIAIWNRGNESLRPANVLTPLTIRTVPSAPILEVKIRTKSRDAIGMALDETHLDDGVVGLSWNILEQGDGGVIQLVYAGNPDKTKIAVAGIIEGQHEIRQLQYSGKILSVAEQVRQEGQIIYLAWFVLAVGMLMMSFPMFSRYFFRGFPSSFKPPLGALNATTFLLGVLFLIFSIIMFIFRIPEPPFGF